MKKKAIKEMLVQAIEQGHEDSGEVLKEARPLMSKTLAAILGGAGISALLKKYPGFKKALLPATTGALGLSVGARLGVRAEKKKQEKKAEEEKKAALIEINVPLATLGKILKGAGIFAAGGLAGNVLARRSMEKKKEKEKEAGLESSLESIVEQGYGDAENLLKEGAIGAVLKAGWKVAKPHVTKALGRVGKLALKGVKTPKIGAKVLGRIGGVAAGSAAAGAIAGRVSKRSKVIVKS